MDFKGYRFNRGVITALPNFALTSLNENLSCLQLISLDAKKFPCYSVRSAVCDGEPLLGRTATAPRLLLPVGVEPGSMSVELESIRSLDALLRGRPSPNFVSFGERSNITVAIT